MRVVFAASGSRGDVQPLVVMALSAKAEGHDVLLCAPPNFAGFAKEHGIAHHPFGVDVEEMLRKEATATTSGALSVLRGFLRVMKDEFEAQFRDLPDAIKGADLILAGGAAFVAPTLAEAHGIPFHLVVYTPVLLKSTYHPPIMVPFQRLPRWMNRFFWWLNNTFARTFLMPPLNRKRRGLGLSPVSDLYDHYVRSTVIVAADETIAPLPPDLNIPHVACGAYQIPGSKDPELPKEIQDFLAAGPAPIYCGFGSMTDPHPEKTTAIVIEAAQKAQARLVLSRGWAGLGMAKVPEAVLLVGSVQHDLLFPRMRAVVHHGGAGTTIAAARAGVAQVVVPHLMDQHYFGHRLQSLGVAPSPIVRPRLNARRLEDALRFALSPNAQKSAQALAQKLRPPLPFGEVLRRTKEAAKYQANLSNSVTQSTL